MQKGFMQVAAWFEVAPEKLAGIKHESIVVADVYNNVKLLRATVACDCYVRVRCVRSGMQHTRHFRRRLKHHSVSHWQLLPRHSIFWHRAKTNTHRFSQRDDYNSIDLSHLRQVQLTNFNATTLIYVSGFIYTIYSAVPKPVSVKGHNIPTKFAVDTFPVAEMTFKSHSTSSAVSWFDWVHMTCC